MMGITPRPFDPSPFVASAYAALAPAKPELRATMLAELGASKLMPSLKGTAPADKAAAVDALLDIARTLHIKGFPAAWRASFARHRLAAIAARVGEGEDIGDAARSEIQKLFETDEHFAHSGVVH
jgi:hypothetical protein